MKKTGIYGIHHVSMKCIDPEKFAEAVRFYTEILGMPVYRRWPAGILIDTGNGKIEIFSNGEGSSVTGAVRHFALAVVNTDELAERVKQAGYEVFDGPRDVCIPSDPPVRARIAFCRGPLGEEIELFDEKEDE